MGQAGRERGAASALHRWHALPSVGAARRGRPDRDLHEAHVPPCTPSGLPRPRRPRVPAQLEQGLCRTSPEVGRGAKLGITASRFLWLQNWMERLLAERVVRVGDFAEAWAGLLRLRRLGRQALSGAALQLRRSLLRPLPLYVLVTLRHLANRLSERRHCPCAIQSTSWQQAWRVDAHASDEGVCIGWSEVDDQGGLRTELSFWFAVTRAKAIVPWAFSREKDQVFRLIASLEAMGVLLALVLFGPMVQGRKEWNQTLLVQASTENLSNGLVLNSLLTTKCPLCSILMELAVRMEDLRARLEVEWTLRDYSAEAGRHDRLLGPSQAGRGHQQHEMASSRRASRGWGRLPERQRGGSSSRHVRQPARKRRKEERLRVRDPWQ